MGRFYSFQVHMSTVSKVWKHDEVLVVDLVHVARAVLLKEERPKWLQRKRKSDD